MFEVIENFVPINFMIYLRYAQLLLKEHVIYALNSTLCLKNVKQYFVHTGLINLQKTKGLKNVLVLYTLIKELVIFALDTK